MKKRVLCFGDSNTWGYDPVTDGRFDEHTRWTARLQELQKDSWTVIEEGLCGRTAVFEDPLNEGMCGLQYLYPCMKSHEPLDAMIIMLGTNDCKERYSATPQNIADGMKRLVRRAKEIDAWRDGPHILLVCPAPMEAGCEHACFAGEMGKCVDKSAQLAPLYEQCARSMEVAFWDAAEVVRMNQIDYMHMDAESHERFVRKVSEILCAVITKY